MAIFRPSNLNKRLTGTPTTTTGGSPGNGGQIGPDKTPYCNKILILGQRCFGSCCSGIFKINESFCGVKENCGTPIDCKGFFICCGPSTTKWFVAPSCTQVSRTWHCRNDAVTVANSCMGSCGWFVPTCGQLQNPGFTCRTYWDSYSSTNYWSNTERFSDNAWSVSMSTGNASYGGVTGVKACTLCVRALRCTAS